MMVKIGLEFFIFELDEPRQRDLLTFQATSVFQAKNSGFKS